MSWVVCSRRRRRVRAYSTFCDWRSVLGFFLVWWRVERGGEDSKKVIFTYSTDAITFIWGRADVGVVCCWRKQRVRQSCEKLIQIHRDVFRHVRCCHIGLLSCIRCSGIRKQKVGFKKLSCCRELRHYGRESSINHFPRNLTRP
jgi:hypothetical protein